MKAQGYGRIVFTSSQSGVFGNPYRGNYGAGKTGVIGLMRVLVQEAPPGICVNSVMPNASGSRLGAPGEDRVDKDFIAAMMAGSQRFTAIYPPDYVAALVTWLASRECDVHGETFSVLRGHYGRVFTGLVDGWTAPADRAPPPEDIAAHMAQIREPLRWDEPQGGIDERDIVTARLERDFGTDAD
jgi:NAD(P)-dependent dehydrogenase (short-subunit alcohol dehydrogenase family)